MKGDVGGGLGGILEIPQRLVAPCIVDERLVAGVGLREPALQRTPARVQVARDVFLREFARRHALEERSAKARDNIRFIQAGKLLDQDAVMGCGKVAVPGWKRMVRFRAADEQAVGIRDE